MTEDFNKTIRPKIMQLAEDILDSRDISNANHISDLLIKNEAGRKEGIEYLQNMVGYTPKRPVYYLYMELRGLPEQTRHVVRNAGDYIDQMIKYCSYDRGDFALLKFRGLRKSLGENLKKLTKALPRNLIEDLERFNEIIYVPSKHEWDVEDSPHLFSSKEAVFVCFIVNKLATRIAPFSQMVQKYNADEMLDYHHDSTQKYNSRI